MNAEHRRGRRRFTIAALIGTLVVAIPYSWVLFDLWNGSPSFLRTAYQPAYASNYYDLQARAIMSGRLSLPAGSLGGLEAFLHNGSTYTYFGIFPSLLRIPILLVTHSLDGKLTALFLMAAWLITGLFTSLLIWRVRIMVRGNAGLGRAEAVSLGTLVAVVLGGSVLVYIAAVPWVFSEDMGWSVALSLGAIFALLGVLERPTWGRVAASGLLILATNLTRVTNGYACIIGALLVALWFGLGRPGVDKRRWWIPMFGIAVLSVIAGSAVSWAKFGVFYGLPFNEYHAYYVLHWNVINGGQGFGLRYFPTLVWTYLGPGGLRFTSLFPFITLPAGPPTGIGGVAFFSADRSANLVTSMPLLFLLSCAGLVRVFRRNAGEVAAMLRLLLVAAATGAGAVLIFSAIADRYLAEFMTFFILASAIGITALWSRLSDWSKKSRLLATVAIVVLGVFGITVNFTMSITPDADWTQVQAAHFLEFQERVSNFTGHPLGGQTLHGNELPNWAPADTVFVAGRCNALYVSTGAMETTALPTLYEHANWIVVEQGAGYAHRLDATFGTPNQVSGQGIAIAHIGHSEVLLYSTNGRHGDVDVRFSLWDTTYPATSAVTSVALGSTHVISLGTDPYKHSVDVTMDGHELLSSPMTGGAPTVIQGGPNGSRGAVAIRDTSPPPPAVALCRRLAAGH